MERQAGGRILSLDVGNRRVGIAMSDESGLLAHPYMTIERSSGQAERKIIECIRNFGIRSIVVGLPLDELGNKTTQCAKIETFCRRLERRVTIEIIFLDEYLTTQEAEALVTNKKGRRGSPKQNNKKGVIDRMAAAILLQSYLDARYSNG